LRNSSIKLTLIGASAFNSFPMRRSPARDGTTYRSHARFCFADGVDGYARALAALPMLLASHPAPAETLAAFAGKDGDGQWLIAESDPLMPVLARLAHEGLVQFDTAAGWVDIAKRCPIAIRPLYVAMGLLDAPHSCSNLGDEAPALVL